jgi:hypothetical protein
MSIWPKFGKLEPMLTKSISVENLALDRYGMAID